MIEDAMKDNASANKDDSYESNFIKHSTNNSELNDSPFNVKQPKSQISKQGDSRNVSKRSSQNSKEEINEMQVSSKKTSLRMSKDKNYDTDNQLLLSP